MKLQRAIIADSQSSIWLVLDDNFLPIKPIQEYLTYLSNIERSPNTVRAYAYHLKLFWEFLVSNRVEWTEVGVRDMSDFIHWLRDPQPTGVTAIYQRTAKRTESSINAILTAVMMFYEYQDRSGKIYSDQFYRQSLPLSGKYKNFLQGISKAKPVKTRLLKLKVPKRAPKTATAGEVSELICACDRLRDKFLVSLLYETGMRIGQALGLRHADIDSRNCEIQIIARDDNANGMRAKTKRSYVIHVSANLMRLYARYLADEVQDVITDYVFVNLWRDPIGKPMSIGAAEDLFRRLSKKTGIIIRPHILRHTHATELIRGGWDPSYVQKRLGHASIQTTINAYVHLTAEDLKKAYEEFQSKRGEI